MQHTMTRIAVWLYFWLKHYYVHGEPPSSFLVQSHAPARNDKNRERIALQTASRTRVEYERRIGTVFDHCCPCWWCRSYFSLSNSSISIVSPSFLHYFSIVSLEFRPPSLYSLSLTNSLTKGHLCIRIREVCIHGARVYYMYWSMHARIVRESALIIARLIARLHARGARWRS